MFCRDCDLRIGNTSWVAGGFPKKKQTAAAEDSCGFCPASPSLPPPTSHASINDRLGPLANSDAIALGQAANTPPPLVALAHSPAFLVRRALGEQDVQLGRGVVLDAEPTAAFDVDPLEVLAFRHPRLGCAGRTGREASVLDSFACAGFFPSRVPSVQDESRPALSSELWKETRRKKTHRRRVPPASTLSPSRGPSRAPPSRATSAPVSSPKPATARWPRRPSDRQSTARGRSACGATS